MSKFMDTIMAACADLCAACAVACEKAAAAAEKSGDAACAQACAACASACRACEVACKGGDMAACAAACEACAEACATCATACAESDAKASDMCKECAQACAACASACGAAPGEPEAEAEAEMSTDGQEPEAPPTVDDANPGAPSALAEEPKDAACADVPLAPAPPPAEGAGGTEPNAQPSQGGDPAVAAAEECFGMIKQATGMDDAAALAWCRENMDKIAALAGQPAAPMSADATTATALTRDLRVADGQVKALTAKLAEYEAGAAKAKADAETAARVAAEARVDALIESGRVLDVARADLIGLALENPARFEGIVKTMPQIVPTARIAATGDSLDKSGAEDLTGIDEKWLRAFDVQLRSAVPDPKQRRELAIKAIRERMVADDKSMTPTNGRA